MLAPATAASSSLNSVLYFQPGFEQEATAIVNKLAAKVKLPSKAIADKPAAVDALNANIVVVVGKSLAKKI